MNRTCNEPIRELFSLEDDETPPPVNSDALERAHRYLSKELTFPIDALYSEPADEDADEAYHVRVTGLLDLDEHPLLGSYLGLLCHATLDENESMTIPLSRIVQTKDEQKRQLIDAYVNWFWDFR